MQRLCQTCFSCGRIIQLRDGILKRDNCSVNMGHSQLKANKNKKSNKIKNLKQKTFNQLVCLTFLFYIQKVIGCVFFLYIPVYFSIALDQAGYF